MRRLCPVRCFFDNDSCLGWLSVPFCGIVPEGGDETHAKHRGAALVQ